MQQHLTAETSQ